MQSALGVAWDVQSDSFVIKVVLQDRPFSKRGVLSTINSIFDPLGMVSPIVLGGRLLQREVMSAQNNMDWDDPLPIEFCQRWDNWKTALGVMERLRIPRPYRPLGFGGAKTQTLHVFGDASSDAIGFVIYMRSINLRDEVSTSFLRGDSKVAPRSATSIPCLELCAAVEASCVTREIQESLQRPNHGTYY